VCEQGLGTRPDCSNHWCGRADRHFAVVWSLSPFAGPLRAAIRRFKYQAERPWAEVFARLIVGFLDDRMPWFDGYDTIVPMPAYTGEGSRRGWDHMGTVAAALVPLAGARWPVTATALSKVAETPAFARLPLAQRRACAETRLRRALVVRDGSAIRGARVLVLDDVFTEGSTLREVARAMLRAGALEVAGLAIARQPWACAPS
jgi:predicted amidophosphoribosyltransferase